MLLHDDGMHSGSRSTAGPTVMSSRASSERAPSESVAHMVVLSSPANVAVR
jgi:hypothetical protein